MWAVFVFEYYSNIELAWLGVMPRTLNGLIGVFTMPLIHGDFSHIASNTLPLIILGSTLYLFYDKVAPKVFLQCYFLTGILIWIVGRSYYHIGASGLIYGIASFLIFFGFFRKDFKSIVISIFIIVLYGGMVYGLLPLDSRVSFEGHLMGAVAGFLSAFINRGRKPNQKTYIE